MNEELFGKFVMRELNRNGSRIDNDAFNYFVQKCGYLISEDVSLYTIAIYLKQLGFSSAEGIITKDAIDAFIPETPDQKSFELSKLLLKKDERGLLALAQNLIAEKENPIAMLSLIERSFRLAYKATLYKEMSDKKIGELLGVPVYQIKDALAYNVDKIERAIELLQKGVNQIKDGAAGPDVIFYVTLGSVLALLKDED